MMIKTTRKVPIGAFRLSGDFVAAKEIPEDQRIPVSINARTAEPVDHWYWGKTYHDFDGMQMPARLALDYCHDYHGDPDDVIGFVEKARIEDGSLICDGFLTPATEDDTAFKIARKGQSGVPYQASIQFDHMHSRIESVPEGMTAEVNGEEIEGPATIFREWPLIGLAVCRLGQDGFTSVQFSKDDASGVEINVFSPEPENTEDGEPESKVDDGLSLVTKLVGLFGADNATEFVAEGLTLVECFERFTQQQQAEIGQLAQQLKQKDEELAQQKEIIAELNKGEDEPVSHGLNGDKQGETEEFSFMPEGLRAFAAATKNRLQPNRN